MDESGPEVRRRDELDIDTSTRVREKLLNLVVRVSKQNVTSVQLALRSFSECT
jgi:hypothetical protein